MRRSAATGTPKRSERPRHTPPIIFPWRARYHSRWRGAASIQLVQCLQRMAPCSFSVRQ